LNTWQTIYDSTGDDGQFKAGVDAVQIFDTWAGVLPPDGFFHRYCIEPCAKIVAKAGETARRSEESLQARDDIRRR
jgi:uroporphyrinogen-III decarboxylase